MRFAWFVLGASLLMLLMGCTYRKEIGTNQSRFNLVFYQEAADGSLVETSPSALPVGQDITAKAFWTNTPDPTKPPFPDVSGSCAITDSTVIDVAAAIGYPQLGFIFRTLKPGRATLRVSFSSRSVEADWSHDYNVVVVP